MTTYVYETDRVYVSNRKPVFSRYVSISPKATQVKIVTEHEERTVRLSSFIATFGDAERAKTEYVTLIFAEVARLFSAAMAERVASVLKEALRGIDIKWVEVDAETFEKAREWCWQHNVKLYEVLSTSDRHVWVDNEWQLGLKVVYYQRGGFVRGQPKLGAKYYVSKPLLMLVRGE